MAACSARSDGEEWGIEEGPEAGWAGIDTRAGDGELMHCKT